MIRLGLCCIFAREPIRFRTTTARALSSRTREEQLTRLSELATDNAAALRAALDYCASHAIGCFRVNSQILPLRTHPQLGYGVEDLPDGSAIRKAFQACGAFARRHALRLTFHPDQFILLSSPRSEVTRASIAELEYQAEVAAWIGADVLNIHGGGVYGDKPAALDRFAATFRQLPAAIRRRLTLENDDRSYTPRDLLPFCEAHRIPLVYDVHHHRCLPDGYTVAEVTARAAATWEREPLFHLSSPREGWQGAHPEHHHDYIDVSDFPDEWRAMNLTVEVEAKAKELAIARLQRDLRNWGDSKMKTCDRRAFMMCLTLLATGGGMADELPEAVTYRKFEITDEGGKVGTVKPLPTEELPQWAESVSQKQAEWAFPDSEFYFADPIPFVVPPPEGSVEPFNRHNHCPAIAWCGNGDLLAAWFSTVSERGMELTILASRLRAGMNGWDPAGKGGCDRAHARKPIERHGENLHLRGDTLPGDLQRATVRLDAPARRAAAARILYAGGTRGKAGAVEGHGV